MIFGKKFFFFPLFFAKILENRDFYGLKWKPGQKIRRYGLKIGKISKKGSKKAVFPRVWHPHLWAAQTVFIKTSVTGASDNRGPETFFRVFLAILRAAQTFFEKKTGAQRHFWPQKHRFLRAEFTKWPLSIPGLRDIFGPFLAVFGGVPKKGLFGHFLADF